MLIASSDTNSESFATTELVPDGCPYFIIGLNGGKIPGRTDAYLPFDIVNCVFQIGTDGKLVLFDVPGMDWDGGDPEKCSIAVDNMTVRLQAILDTCDNKGVEIVKASDVCNEDPERFADLVANIREIAMNDEKIGSILWRIIPSKLKSGISQKPESSREFSNLTSNEKKDALVLADYEIHHLAFMLFCKGQKFFQGRSEERSAQIMKILLTDYSEQLGFSSDADVVFPQKISALHKGKAPYGMSVVPGNLELAEGVLGEIDQIPLKASVQIADSVSAILGSEGEGRLRSYLGAGANLPGMKEFLNSAKFDTPEAVCLSTSCLIKNCIWPIEKRELEMMKESAPEVFFAECFSKLNNILNSLALSPRMRVIIDELMPVFFSKIPFKHLAPDATSSFAKLTGKSYQEILDMIENGSIASVDMAKEVSSVPRVDAPSSREVVENTDALETTEYSDAFKFQMLRKFAEWIKVGFFAENGPVASHPIVYERDIFENLRVMIDDISTILSENSFGFPEHEDEIAMSRRISSEYYNSDWWKLVQEIDEKLNTGTFSQMLDDEKGMACAKCEREDQAQSLRERAYGVLLSNSNYVNPELVSFLVNGVELKDLGVPGLSLEAKTMLFEKLIIPVLADAGNQEAMRILAYRAVGRNADGRGYLFGYHGAGSDNLLREFCKLNAQRLEVSQSLEDQQLNEARVAIGLSPLDEWSQKNIAYARSLRNFLKDLGVL